MADPCVFCQIVAGEAPAAIVGDWAAAIMFRPLGPVVPGHLLVVPKAHVESFAEDPAIAGLAMQYAAAYANVAGGQWNLITSAGPDATQTVFHLHLHLVPREAGDSVSLPWDVRRG